MNNYKYIKRLVRPIKYFCLATFLILPSHASSVNNTLLIETNPKEVIDQVWQIIYRDYMDVSESFS